MSQGAVKAGQAVVLLLLVLIGCFVGGFVVGANWSFVTSCFF